MRLAQVLGWNCVDDRPSFCVVMRMCDLFEEALTIGHELGICRGQVAKDRERASQIMHRRRSPERRCPFQGYGDTTSDDIVAVFGFGQLEFVVESSGQLERKSLIGAL